MPPCGWLLVSDEDGVVHVKDMKDDLKTVKKLRVFPSGVKIISMCVDDGKGLVGVMAESEIRVINFVSEKVVFAFNSGGQGDFHCMDTILCR